MFWMAGRLPSACHARLLTLLIGVMGLAALPATASPTYLVGTTAGCFGTGCNSFETVSDSSFGLTFRGLTAFDIPIDTSEAFDSVNLGTFIRDNVNVSSDLPAVPFTLQMRFSTPTGSSDRTFGASISGWSLGGGGPLTVDFSAAWEALAFAGGTLELRLLDGRLTKNGESNLIGQFRGDAVPISEQEVVQQDVTPLVAVPEPATLILFGTGLVPALGVGFDTDYRRC